MKKIYFILILILPMTLLGQENLSYKSNNQKIEFKISANEFYVKYNPLNKKTIKKELKIKSITELPNNYAIVKIESRENKKSLSKQKTEIIDKYQLKKVEPVLIYKDGVKQICNEEIIIRVNNKINLKEILSDYNYTLAENEFVKNQFTLKIKGISTQEIFKLIEKLEKNKNVIFAEPNFTRFLKPQTNDPFFNSQWSINNQGYLGGTADADMDVNEAWSLSTGSGIKVAVIDEGVDLTHPDLMSNLLGGYDATDGDLNGAPNKTNNDAHGTACAGIIASVANNNKGTVGVAYNTKIIPVRIGYSNGLPFSDPNRTWITNNNWLANGISWAKQNGADILSNSWGGGSPSSAINNAINNAVNNGRNGKGCIVLFSTGNYNTNVSYPATLNNVIAVGASSMCDERKSSTSDASLLVNTLTQPDANGTSCDGEWWWGSNFGNEIDIVAPGVKIFTTDISGSNGYNTGDYKSDFNGTSSACPNAAGVAALVLSVNPNFTQAQVREILETTTDKIGNTPYNLTFQNYGATQTWNNEVGYGRLNAYSAVQKALNYDGSQSHYITGPAQITPGYQAFYKFSEPYTFATNYVWSIPSGCTYHYCWDIIQGQGSSVLRIKAGKTGRQDITCKVYNGSTLIGNHYISVNVQNPYNGGGGNEDPCDGDVIVMPMVIYPPEPCENENMNINNISERLYFKKVVVYNFQGQKVIETKEKQEVDISHLSSGIYIIKAELSNGEIMTKKILRE